MMKQTVDTILHFRGLGGFPSRCCLRVWEEPGQPAVAIATELAENEGTSVTNAAALIAEQVWRLLEAPPAGLVLIEQYPKDGPEPHAQERFALVTFAQDVKGGLESVSPTWQHITKAEIANLIGASFVKDIPLGENHFPSLL